MLAKPFAGSKKMVDRRSAESSAEKALVRKMTRKSACSAEKARGQTLVAVYTRVSTDTQELTRQNEELIKFLKSNTIKDEDPESETYGQDIPKYIVWNGKGYQDQAKSGRTFQREDLKKMMTDAKMNQFELVITWGLSRLGRNLKETVNYLDKLEKAGVDYHDCQMSLTFSNDMHRTMIYTMAAYHDHQWREMRRNTQEKMSQIDIELKGAGCRLGNAGILDEWIESPRAVREDKQGLAVQFSEAKAEAFRELWNEGVPIKTMCYHFRNPINPKCGFNKSPAERKHFCGGKPPRDDELAKQATLKCYCNRPCTGKTITVNRIRLGLPIRNPHSFKSSEKVSGKDESLMFDFSDAEA